jgi:uncharacterized phage protein gp47/JayE
MFENMTFDSIMESCLAQVSSDVDKREGSIIYDALAPAVLELVNFYISLDIFLDEAFADTATRDYLVRRALERGLEPYAATKAVLKGVFNQAVEIGSRFNLETINYVVTELIDDETHTYKLECETAGADGNLYLGKMTPIDYIDGLTSAELTEVLVYGEDEEHTEVFRKRYLESINTQAFAGNVADYKQRVKALDGVGQVRVYRADEWNGGGTVKLVITDSNNGVPTTELISEVQEAVDPIENTGKGMGFAPIGHIVTVAGVNAEEIDVDLSVVLKDGYTVEGLKPYIIEKINNYFEELNSAWEDNYNTDEDCITIVVSRLASDVQSVTGIANITDLTVGNAGFGSVFILPKDCLAKLDISELEVNT